MAVITIDGIRLEVPENKNVLECALEAGIYIPHLCHHPDLPENGSLKRNNPGRIQEATLLQIR